MAQVQASGLRIDTSLASRHLSLHDYRKFLSREDNASMPSASPRPRLRRKPAALNLCQRSHQDLTFQLQSPVSSAPSSPPPLSFSQSVISLPGGDLPTPISPMSIVRPFSRHVSSVHSLGARRMDPFSARLKRPAQNFASHSRTSSDSTLPSPGASTIKVKHRGAEFEILNPKSPSSYHFSDNTIYRLSSLFKDTMEEESPDISPTHSFMSYTIPDDTIRPLSASESAVLSKHTTPAISPGLPPSSYSFSALPPLKELPSTPVSPRSPRTPAETLKKKVSRLFGGSDRRPSPRHEIDLNEKYDHDKHHNERDVPHSPISNHWAVDESIKPVHKPSAAAETTSSEYENHDSSHQDSEDVQFRRRPTWRPHSSNRHQTLQDALRQLEIDNNGLAFRDIMRYIGTEDKENVEPGGNHDESLDEKTERPWQPDTWNEPTLVRMPHNRPSDSNLSTNAPSTRASIRPYVERAAAFMAGGSRFSASSLSLDLGEEKHETLSVKIISRKENEEDQVAEDENERTYPLRRSISRRARPLSSNPPELDTPLLFDSSSSSLASDDRAITPPSPNHTTTPELVTRMSWSPEIPARHPDHRIFRFEDNLTSTISPRAGTPPPPLNLTASQSAGPRVVTTTIARRRKVKKHCNLPCEPFDIDHFTDWYGI